MYLCVFSNFNADRLPVSFFTEYVFFSIVSERQGLRIWQIGSVLHWRQCRQVMSECNLRGPGVCKRASSQVVASQDIRIEALAEDKKAEK